MIVLVHLQLSVLVVVHPTAQDSVYDAVSLEEHRHPRWQVSFV